MKAPLPFAEKTDAIIYMNRNCETHSGRADIMRAIMGIASADMRVHSWGGCDHNMNAAGQVFNKIEKFRGYKFCVAMENTQRKVSVCGRLIDPLPPPPSPRANGWHGPPWF